MVKRNLKKQRKVNKKSSDRDALRLLDEYWDAENIVKLKELANELANKLYPGVITPLIETDDIVSSYLDSSRIYKFTATIPYVKNCIYKYPPYNLNVNNVLTYKRFKINRVPHYIDIKIDEGCSDSLLNLTINSIEPEALSKLNSNDISIGYKVDILDGAHALLNDLEVTELEQYQADYKKNINYYAREREELLREILVSVSKNEMIKYFDKNIKFNLIFNSFFHGPLKDDDFEFKDIIKYRFLLHILIIFLKIVGSKDDTDLTLNKVRDYNEVVNRSCSDKYAEIRAGLNKRSQNNSVPTTKKVETINNQSSLLLKKLYGCTDDFDFLKYLIEYSEITRDRFTKDGLLTDKRNKYIRVFIKSMASFFVAYNFDYLSTCSLVLKEEIFDDEFKCFKGQVDSLVGGIVGMFYQDIDLSGLREYEIGGYVKYNTENIYDEFYHEIKKLLELNKHYRKVKNDIQPYIKDHHVMNKMIKPASEFLGHDVELLMGLMDELEGIESTDEKLNRIKSFLNTKAEPETWAGAMDLIGYVSDYEGTAYLSKLEHVAISDKQLRQHVENAKVKLAKCREMILKDCGNV